MSGIPSGAVDGISAGQFNDMMEKGVVSVLTPVYNGEAYISRLLNSVLEQTYPNIEMILVDDGSTDDTVGTATAYASEFTAKGYSFQIIQAPHKNASAAISAGLCHVTGEYLAWPDADDELCPDSIEKRVQFLKCHPEYCCVRSIMEYISDKTGEVMPPVEQNGDLKKEDLFWDVLEGRSFVCCGCYLLKTKEFFKIYPSKKIPEYEVGQNFQMLLPYLFQYRCPTIPEKLYRVYVREDSHSRKRKSEAEEEFRVKCFEELADEIVQICGLEGNKETVNRVQLWKLNRRKWLAHQYNHVWRLNRYKFRIMCLYLKQFCRRFEE